MNGADKTRLSVVFEKISRGKELAISSMKGAAVCLSISFLGVVLGFFFNNMKAVQVAFLFSGLLATTFSLAVRMAYNDLVWDFSDELTALAYAGVLKSGDFDSNAEIKNLVEFYLISVNEGHFPSPPLWDFFGK